MFVWMSLANTDQSQEISYQTVPDAEILYLRPNMPYVTIWNAFQIETICTFMFVLCNLIVKTQRTSPSDEGFFGCIAISTTLLAMICVSGSKTGGCLNPAVGLAQTLYQNFVSPDSEKDWQYLWMYIVAPFTGGILAGLAHRLHVASFKLIVPFVVPVESKYEEKDVIDISIN